MNPVTELAWGVADDGAVVEVQVGAGAVPALDRAWPPRGLERGSDAPASPATLKVSARVLAPGTEPQVEVDGVLVPGGWHRVESELALFAAERLAGLVAVHAAVIAASGRALLVPGPSMSGKSTMCVAAVEAGAVVLTDEYALVEPTSGLVVGWRRPVKMRRESGRIERLDLVVESDPIPVGLVALVRHDATAGLAIEEIPPADAVLGLLGNTVCAQSRPDEALDAALALVDGAATVAGTRGEAAEAVAVLLERMHDAP